MTALRYKEHGLWRDISWKNFQEQLNQLSRALLAHNVGVQDKIAIFRHNMERWTIADICDLTNSSNHSTYLRNQYRPASRIYPKSRRCKNSIRRRSKNNTIKHWKSRIIVHNYKNRGNKSTIQLQQDPLSCTWESFIETGSNAQQDELA